MDEPKTHVNTGAPNDPPVLDPKRPTSDRTRDDETFAGFYRDVVPKLVTFLRWQGVQITDATDIAQETMILAYRDWVKIEHPAAWARRVASRMWAKRVAGNLEYPTFDEQAQHPVLLGDASACVAWEQRHDVLRVLDQLPPRQRQVLAWTLEGETPSEIASQLNMTPEAVRSSLKKARRAAAAYLRTLEENDERP